MNENIGYQYTHFTEQQHNKEFYKFLSICGYRCRGFGRQLFLSLQKKKQIKITHQRITKIMRKIGLDKGFAKKITLLLGRSNLSLDEQRKIAMQIRKILLNFSLDMFSNLDLCGLNLNKLPLSIRKFIIALMLLKAEIAHLFRLELEKKRRLAIEFSGLSKDRINHLNMLYDYGLNIDNHKYCRNGVSLSKGNYAGMRDFSCKTRKTNEREKKINFDFNITKHSRNEADKQQRNKQNYYNKKQNIQQKNDFNKDDFYKKNDHIKQKQTSY